jgi:hypothetical protein
VVSAGRECVRCEYCRIARAFDCYSGLGGIGNEGQVPLQELAAMKLHLLVLAGVSVLTHTGWLTHARATTTSHCDGTIRPVPGPLGYRARGSYCEGLYQADYAGSLALVSLSTGPRPAPRASRADLRVLPPEGARTPVHVRVLTMDLKTQYQLDAVAQADGTFSWPLTTVVHASSIPVYLLGYLAWVIRGTESVYLPVSLGKQPADGNVVEARVLAELEPEIVYWRAYATSSKDPKAAAWRRVDLTAPGQSLLLHTAGDPPRVLTFSFPSALRETIRVDIRVKSRNSDTLSELEFLVDS